MCVLHMKTAGNMLGHHAHQMFGGFPVLSNFAMKIKTLWGFLTNIYLYKTLKRAENPKASKCLLKINLPVQHDRSSKKVVCKQLLDECEAGAVRD